MNDDKTIDLTLTVEDKIYYYPCDIEQLEILISMYDFASEISLPESVKKWLKDINE